MAGVNSILVGDPHILPALHPTVPLRKRVCLFHCDRSDAVDIAICDRIESVRNEGHVLLTKPTDVKSLILRFVENLDICNDRRQGKVEVWVESDLLIL